MDPSVFEVDDPALQEWITTLASTEALPLVRYRVDGSLPVVLTAPHGGLPSVGSQAGLTLRTFGRLMGDKHTMSLVSEIDVALQGMMGRQANVTTALFHRKFIDLNRHAREAYPPDCTNARKNYDAYHERVSECIDNALPSMGGRCILLDIHGMGTYADNLVVGTRNGTTCDSDVRSGTNVHAPHSGFMWHLRRLLGNMVLPLTGDKDVQEYSGGHTVKRHGKGRCDAFQLEFGGDLRGDVMQRRAVATSVAEAITHTLYPMGVFVRTLAEDPRVRWSDLAQLRVQEKLRKVNITSPADLVRRIDVVNDDLDDINEPLFCSDTIGVMSEVLSGGSCADTSLALGEKQGPLIHRYFMYDDTQHGIDSFAKIQDATVMGFQRDAGLGPCTFTGSAKDSISGQLVTLLEPPLAKLENRPRHSRMAKLDEDYAALCKTVVNAAAADGKIYQAVLYYAGRS